MMDSLRIGGRRATQLCLISGRRALAKAGEFPTTIRAASHCSSPSAIFHKPATCRSPYLLARAESALPKLQLAAEEHRGDSDAKNSLASTSNEHKHTCASSTISATPSCPPPSTKAEVTSSFDVTADESGRKELAEADQNEIQLGRGWRTMWQPEFRNLPKIYLQLSKSRLTGLVVVTAVAGYVAAPATFSWTTFAAVTIGTGLCSAAANAINQTIEIPYDAQMARTKGRVLVRDLISPLHAVTFAVVCSLTGATVLAVGANPLTAALGIGNLLLYTAVYTPLKRLTIWNTWVGAWVGAIPPLMGWAACMGSVSQPAAWVMPLVLYCWQFPHFNSLSWMRRDDYSRGGYIMTANTDPGMCRRVALRHCLALFGLGLLVPVAGLTTWSFICGGAALLNTYLVYLGWNFYDKADINAARRLFVFSNLHMLGLMLLLVVGAFAKNRSCIGSQQCTKDLTTEVAAEETGKAGDMHR